MVNVAWVLLHRNRHIGARERDSWYHMCAFRFHNSDKFHKKAGDAKCRFATVLCQFSRHAARTLESIRDDIRRATRSFSPIYVNPISFAFGANATILINRSLGWALEEKNDEDVLHIFSWAPYVPNMSSQWCAISLHSRLVVKLVGHQLTDFRWRFDFPLVRE